MIILINILLGSAYELNFIIGLCGRVRKSACVCRVWCWFQAYSVGLRGTFPEMGKDVCDNDFSGTLEVDCQDYWRVLPLSYILRPVKLFLMGILWVSVLIQFSVNMCQWRR